MANATESPRNPAPPRQGSSELGLRVASALAMGAAALLVTYQGGWIFALFWLAAAEAILFEWLAMTKCEPQLRLQLLLGTILAALALLVPFRDVGLLGIVAACVLAAGAIAFGPRRPRDRRWAAVGLAYAAVIAIVPPMVREHPQLGLVGILWMFAVVWASDIAAYFTGRRLGGPKLLPRVSPKKTWSGFLGGLVAGIAAGVLVVVLAEKLGPASPVDLVTVGVISAVASVLGQLGDLAESALKRRFGVKDSSHLIPGHGGVMDRLDAFWAVSALMGLILAGAHGFRAGWTTGG